MKTLIALLLLGCVSSLSAQQPLTLEESVELGLKASKLLKISESKAAGAEAVAQEVGSRGLPQLSLGAFYTRYSDIRPFEFETPLVPEPIKISDPILDYYGVQLAVRQPLFTGFELSSLRQSAELGHQSARKDLDAATNGAALYVHTAFWNLYRAEQVVKLVHEYLHQVDKHLSDTRKFLENDLVVKNDVLKLEVQKADVELAKIDAEHAVILARIAFNQAIGRSPDAETTIEPGSFSPEKPTQDIDVLVSTAKSQRHEILALQLSLEAAEQQVRAAGSGYLPDVYASANLYYARPNPRIQPQQEQFEETWDAGVSLSWSLWDWGGTGSKTEQAKQQVVQAKNALAQLEEDIELEVHRGYLNMKKAHDKLLVSRKAVKQADENYRLIESRYNAQVATSSELIDAEVALNEARTNYTTALVDYQLAQTRLRVAIGERVY